MREKIRIITANEYYKRTFGQKIYKLSLDAGCTCPNRDGTLGTKGCIFCSNGGSGEFAADRTKSITAQIEEAKGRVDAKMPKNADSNKYTAYFQAFTNTYGNADELKAKYLEAITHPDIVALSIATRPDCISDEMLEIISSINKSTPVYVELGLQTIHESTAEYIRRGYQLETYDKCVERLSSKGIDIITHIILGLPGESEEMMLQSVDYVRKTAEQHPNITCGIKLQLLHVLKGTDLEKAYNDGVFEVLTLEEYVDIIYKSLAILEDKVVIHRLTGDGDKKLLVAPLWSANKKLVLNEINKLYTTAPTTLPQ